MDVTSSQTLGFRQKQIKKLCCILDVRGIERAQLLVDWWLLGHEFISPLRKESVSIVTRWRGQGQSVSRFPFQAIANKL